MSVFGKIKDAIFGKKAAAQSRPAQSRPAQGQQAQTAQGRQAQPAQAQPAQAQPSQTPGGQQQAPQPGLATAAPAAGSAPQQVDIEAILASMAAKPGQQLNWRTSIVDLMKLVGMESSLAERKELAQELGYTGPLDGSAEMNTWLHKRVMQELAAHGGKVPPSMLN